MKLKIGYQDFKTGLLKFNLQFEELSQEGIKSEDELQNAKAKLSEIKKKCAQYIKDNITGEISEDFTNGILYENSYDLGMRLPLEQSKKNFVTSIKERISNVDYVWQAIELSDPLMTGRSFKIEREEMTVSEKEKLFLSKLYDARKTNRPWDANTIFELNEVTLDNYNEAREIASGLSRMQLIEAYGTTNGLACKILTKGKSYYEENNKPNKISYTYYEDNSDKYDLEEFEEKLRDIEALLNNKMAGMEEKIQEIMDELKTANEHIDKLDKKTIGQLIKGKLVEVITDKALSKEVLTTVAKFLVEGSQTLLNK
jgi:hypothetical protein